MTTDQLLVFLTLLGLLAAFIYDKWRYDLVALMGLGVSVALGTVPFDQAFIGSSNPAVTTVACILVMSAALGRSGFVDFVLKKITRFLNRPYAQVFVLSLLVICLSAFMNNIGALAVVLPIALVLVKKAGRSASELLMPLSFGSLLGGLITLIGTPPNLLIANIRTKYAGEPFEMFDFSPVGISICAGGLLYLTFCWKILPRDRTRAAQPENIFNIEDYISEVKVAEDSVIADKKVHEVENNFGNELDIVGLVRAGTHIIAGRNTIIRADDILVVQTNRVSLKKFIDSGRLILTGNDKKDAIPLSSDEASVVEAVVMSDSELIGMSVKQLNLRQRFGLNLLAVRQNYRRKPEQLKNIRFYSGDIIVLQGEQNIIHETLQELDCLPLAERNLQLGRRYYASLPIIIMAVAVLSTIVLGLAVAIAFAGAVLAIALFKILRMDEIYEAINWPIIILLGALLPVTDALQNTKGHELLADALIPLTNSLPGWGVLTLVMVSTLAVTPFLNNAAAVLVMAPVAASLATKLNMNIDPFLMAVAIGASSDFLTPIGHQSNTLVMGPGGYKFSDYFRFGFPLTIIVVVIGVPAIMYSGR